jgi:hypothetical protein
MNPTEAVIDGTLRADGTLELDERPNLSPGRVKVVLQPAQACAQPRRGLANVIDEILRGRLARGEPGRSADDIDSGLREGEDEYEKKMQELVANGRTPPAVGS